MPSLDIHDHPPYGPCHHLLLDGRQVHLVDYGTGPAIVLVHGGQAWSYAWRHQIAP